MNEFLNTIPFDLYELSLFHLVVETGSFTKAGQQAGLTQSAITRQIRGMEESLGVALFERTTRHVDLTLAGRLLYEKSGAILSSTNDLLRQLQHDFHLVPQTIRVGIARSIGLAYFPGFFFAFQKKFPAVQLHLTQKTSTEISDLVEANLLDVGIYCPPARLPRGIEVTNCFADEFTIIAPPKSGFWNETQPGDIPALKEALKGQRWLMIDRESNTGGQLRNWLGKYDWSIEPAMELDSFDLIVNLVSLGLGVSMVPHRALPIYEKRRAVKRLAVKQRFVRQLAVIVRKNRNRPEHLTGFIDNILF